MTMAVVSIAITLSFHVKHQPSDFERRMAKPLGVVFWCLSVVMLLIGLGNYIRELFASPACYTRTDKSLCGREKS
jgi:O-antigen/teichoic acid export membrane protein